MLFVNNKLWVDPDGHQIRIVKHYHMYRVSVEKGQRWRHERTSTGRFKYWRTAEAAVRYIEEELHGCFCEATD
jgi:hypothetical protein